MVLIKMNFRKGPRQGGNWGRLSTIFKASLHHGHNAGDPRMVPIPATTHPNPFASVGVEVSKHIGGQPMHQCTRVTTIYDAY